jgi:hypothetical protein
MPDSVNAIIPATLPNAEGLFGIEWMVCVMVAPPTSRRPWLETALTELAEMVR